MTDLVPAPSSSSGVAWPSTPRAFADTSLCPRCFSVLPSSLCPSCGLELGVARAAELIAVSNTLVETEQRRRELIERMWNEQLAARVQSVSALPMASPQGASTGVPDAAVAAAASVAPPAFPTAEPVRVPADAAPRRSGVQVFLLVAGIVLLSVFALFFLTVAYLFATVEVRVVVTALAGLVLFGAAWVLQLRRLPATAEGVGVAGAAILLGTLGFVRGAELFSSASIPPTLFSGAGLLVVAALVEMLHRATALRFARIGSLLLAPTGLALFIVGALDAVDVGLAWWAGLLTAGVCTLLVRDGAGRAAEGALLRSIAFVSMTAALVPAALLLPELPASSALAFSASAAGWGAFVLRLRSDSGLQAWSSTASVLLGLSVSLAPAVAILRTATAESNLWAPGAASGVVATALVVLARRSSNVPTRRALAWAQIPALVVAAVGLLPGVGFALVHVLTSLIPRYTLWQATPGDVVGIIPETAIWAAVLAPAIAGVLAAAASGLVRLPNPVRICAGGATGLAMLAAASHGGSVLLVLLGYLLVAVLGLSVLLVARGDRASAVQAPAAGLLGVSVVALLVLSHASSELWPAGVLTAVGLVVASRFAIAWHSSAGPVLRALLTAVAAAVLFAEAALVVPWSTGWSPGAAFDTIALPSPIEFAALPAVAAAIVLCVTPVILGPPTNRGARGAADLRAVALVALPVAAAGTAVLFAATALSPIDHAARITIPLLVAVACVLWQIRGSEAHTLERVTLASMAPLSIGALLASVAAATPASPAEWAGSLSGPAAAILSAAVGVLVFGQTRSGPRGASRIGWESSTGVVVVVAVGQALANVDDSTWLLLLLLAVPPLVVAFSDGNPFTRSTRRRHFTVPSCILAVAALWQFLSFRGITEVEPYTLPVGGLLLCIATAGALFGRRSASPVPGRSILFAAGLVTALAPSALTTLGAASDSSVRAVVLLVVTTVLVSAGLVSPRVIRGVLVRDSAVILALVVLVGVGLARTVRDADENAVLVPEVWVLPAAVALAATSIVWTRRRALPFRVAQLGVPAAVALLGVATVVCLVILPDTSAPERLVSAPERLVAASVLLGGVAVWAAVHRRVPLDRVSQYTALSLLATVALTGLATSAAQPFELSTAPLGLALIASGVVALLRDRAARSWPNLGPGVVILLAPSLLADFGDTDLWRVIALGVLSIAVVLAAIAFRLQAPLVVGAVVLIAHALAQSWPWIQGLYSAVPWWIWLGVGGVLLIAVAARYEHRVRNLRAFVGSIAALR